MEDPIPASTFSYEEIELVEKELVVHHDASRVILLHICERLSQLESIVKSVQNDVVMLRSDAADATDAVQNQVDTIADQLTDVSNVVNNFHGDMYIQKQDLTTLSMDHHRLDDKVEQQRQAMETRFDEFNNKLNDLRVQVAKPRDSTSDFSFVEPPEKVLVKQHVLRTDNTTLSNINGGRMKGAYTDLQMFTVSDEMKAKLEATIREKRISQSVADKQMAMELSEAYRRLQLAGYPRVTEIHMHVEQCREEIKRAFDLIQTSNLQLYACCESKATKGDILMLQNELQQLQEDSKAHPTRPISNTFSVPPPPLMHQQQQQQALSSWNLDKYFHPIPNHHQPTECVSIRAVHLTRAQIPELRVSLLEMSRNLNALRKQYIRKMNKIEPWNPILKSHFDVVVALLADAYAATTENPVDLERVMGYVEKIASKLGSEFSQMIAQMMATTGYIRGERASIPRKEIEGGGDSAVVKALDRYSQAFNGVMTNHLESSNGSHSLNAGVVRAMHQEHTKEIDRIRSDMSEVLYRQRELESTVRILDDMISTIKCTKQTNTGHTTDSGADHALPDNSNTLEVRQLADQVNTLRDQLQMMRRHFVSEETFGDVARYVEQLRKERERQPINGIVGQRVVGGVSPIAPPTSSLRRSLSGTNHTSDLDAYIALTSSELGVRPQQGKLDPLQISRIGGGGEREGGVFTPSSHIIPNATPTSPIVKPMTKAARHGALSKIQARAQAMRPKSGTSQHPPSSPWSTPETRSHLS